MRAERRRQVLYSFRVDVALLDGLRHVFDKTGVTVSEQLRRLIVTWLEKQGEPLPDDARTMSGRVPRTAKKRTSIKRR
jgi:hypothetical protein